MRYLMTFVFMLFNTGFLHAFEGNIQLFRYSQYDSTYFVFYIKDSKVRLDEFDSSGKLNKVLIVNLATNNIMAMSPALKLYTDISKKETVSHHTPKVDVIKTDNYKIIEGKKCFQWRVRNTSMDCEITYWVMESQLIIMEKLYHILDVAEKYSSIPSYFRLIPNNDGFIPLLAVERNLVQEQKQSMQITSINERKVSASLFEIPRDYKPLNNLNNKAFSRFSIEKSNRS